MKTTYQIKTQVETAYKEAQPYLDKFVRMLRKHGIECPTCIDYQNKTDLKRRQCEDCDPILLSRWWPKEEDNK